MHSPALRLCVPEPGQAWSATQTTAIAPCLEKLSAPERVSWALDYLPGVQVARRLVRLGIGYEPDPEILDESLNNPEVLGARIERYLANLDMIGMIASFPIRTLAMADAARCYAEAGDDAKALTLFSRLEVDAPEYRLTPAMQSRLGELRAIQ